jgi:hypothetical protein
MLDGQEKPASLTETEKKIGFTEGKNHLFCMPDVHLQLYRLNS